MGARYGRGVRVLCQRSEFEREAVVPVLVVGSLVISVVAGVAVGVERPYPGVALDSGLLLVAQRAAGLWGAALLVLVIVDQALRGRLPVEVGGRGVRYAEQEHLDGAVGSAVEANAAIVDRLDELEADFEALERLLKDARSSFVK